MRITAAGKPLFSELGDLLGQPRNLAAGGVMMNLAGLRLPFAAFTADMDEARRSIQKVAQLQPRVVCFGHGQPLTENAAEKVSEFAGRVR